MTTSKAPPSASARIDFQGGGPFYAELRSRVRDLLADPRRVRRAQRAMYVKSAIVIAWAVAS
jgi:linoleoyl-CoA desaturase